MLRLILGRTGTGKTRRLISEAIEAAQRGGNVLVVVPEQFSFETEQQVHARIGDRPLSIEVVSFSRLAEEIFRSCGGLAGRRLDAVSRTLILRLASQEMKDTLTVYGGMGASPAFLSSMLSLVEELKREGVYAEDLTAAAVRIGDDQLKAKLADIAGIYAAYQSILERSFTDPSDDILRAAKKAEERRWFAGRSLFIDGFSYFGAPERRLISAMLEQSEGVCVSLTCDGLALRDADLFSDQKETAARLVSAARACGCGVAPPVVLEENFRLSSGALRYVEELVSDGGEPPVPEDGSPIRLCVAADKYEEARLAAAGISGLVRREGLRFRDCAVVCRDLDAYRAAIDTAFEKYGLPVFMDRKESVAQKPIVSAVLSALAACRSGSRAEAILRLARSPALGLAPEEAGALENYCYVWSVEGDGWLRPFRNDPEGLTDRDPAAYAAELARLEAARTLVVAPLEKLRGALQSSSGREFSAALYAYVTDTKMLQNLRAYCERTGDARALSDNSRLWEQIVDILDLFCDVLPDARGSLAEMSGLFSLCLSAAELGQVPNTRDQIVAGSADRVRLSSPRAVFVLGLNEGEFPLVPEGGGMLTDRERRALIDSGVAVGEPGVRRVLAERYCLYMALCASGGRLYLSCHSADLKGEAAQPSRLFSRLWDSFPGSRVLAEELPPAFFAAGAEADKAEFARLRAADRPERVSFAAFLRERGEGDFVDGVEAAARDLPAGGISPQTARRLAGARVSLSPTQIESYYRCPYAYFAERMLRLRPRRRVEYSPLQSGTAVHYVLEQMMRRYASTGLPNRTLGELEAELRALLEEYIRERVPDVERLSGKFRYQIGRQASVLAQVVVYIFRDLAQSGFAAADVEVPVGAGGVIRSAALRTDDGTPIALSGKIDRVDVWKGPRDSYARVIDYKSGAKDFRLEEVFHGLNMQMLIYLFCLCDDRDSPLGPQKPAGILYMPGRIEPKEFPAGADVASLGDYLGKALRMKGLILDDEGVLAAMEKDMDGRFIPVYDENGKRKGAGSLITAEKLDELRDTVYGNIRAMAEAVLSGEVSPMPARGRSFNPCDACDYGALCNNRNTPLYKDIT